MTINLSRYLKRLAKPRNKFQTSRGLTFDSLEQRTMLTTIFVDGAAAPGGDGSASSPFNAIQDGINAARDLAGADRVRVAEGNYQENLSIEDPHPLEIDGRGSTVTSAGLSNHTIEITGGNVTLRRLEVTGAAKDGISAELVDLLVLDRLNVSNNGDEGVAAANIGDLIVRFGVYSQNQDDGIQVEGANNVTMFGTVVLDNDNFDPLDRKGDGIDLELVSGNIDIRNIVSSNNGDEGLEVDDSGSLSVRNSVFTGNQEAGIDADDTVNVFIWGVAAQFNGENGLQVEAQDDFQDDNIVQIESVYVGNSVFTHNVGDGIQIVEENVEPDGPDAEILSVEIFNVVVAFNEELAPGVGGHGLFIDISGEVELVGVLSFANPNGDFIA